MVKRLSFLLVCAFINVSVFASHNDSPDQGMGERTVAFYRVPFNRTLVIDSSSYALDRINNPLIFDNEYNDPVDDPIRYISYLFDNGLIDQEELVRGKVTITSAFQAVLATANYEIKDLIANPANLVADFSQCFAQLNTWYAYVLNGEFSKNQKIMARHAMQTLSLLNGDSSISRHAISAVLSYSDFKYPLLPNAKELFVFACKLADVGDPKKFLLAYLAENFAETSKWHLWKKPFERFFPGILTHDNLGLALAADEESGGKFSSAFTEFLRFGEVLPCAITNSRDLRIMGDLFKSYINHSLEKINPITEALFMARRGHNIELFDACESDRPACAEGLYLNLLKETSAMLNGGEIFMVVEINHCA